MYTQQQYFVYYTSKDKQICTGRGVTREGHMDLASFSGGGRIFLGKYKKPWKYRIAKETNV